MELKNTTKSKTVTKKNIKTGIFITLLAVFFIFLGIVTRGHIAEYNDSLVKVDVVLPGKVVRKNFVVLPTEVQYADGAPGFKATAILSDSELYGEFEFKQGDKAKIRTANGRSIEYKSVAVQSDLKETRITLTFEDDRVKVGDRVEIVLDAVFTEIVLNAVPYEALYQESNHYFFYEVVKRKGIWGYEYVLKKNAPQLKKVESGYAYFKGYAAKAPIVIHSEEELADGMRVKFQMQR